MIAKRSSTIVLAALLSVSIAACGDDDDEKDTAATSSTTAPTTATTVAVAEGLRPFPTVTVPIPDSGEQPDDGELGAYVSAVDLDGKTITVDYIEFLTGDEANAAYLEDTGSTEPVPDDYYIRDTDKEDVTLDVADDVEVTLLDLEGSVANVPSTFDKVQTSVDSLHNPFWLTVKAGVVVAINEQFVP